MTELCISRRCSETGGILTKPVFLPDYHDLKSGLAIFDTSAKSGRVHGQFTPESSADAAKPFAAARKADAAKPEKIGAGHCRSFARRLMHLSERSLVSDGSCASA